MGLLKPIHEAVMNAVKTRSLQSNSVQKAVVLVLVKEKSVIGKFLSSGMFK
jgi:hypothetical protein